jgi:zinc transport system substrate-binding protein
MILILVALSVCLAVAPAGAAPAERVAVVASFYPLFEFARQVGGDRVAVRTLVPPGVESHDYEPTPRDVVAMTRARVLIYNGAGFEPWVGRVLPQLPARVVRVNATEGLPLVTATSGPDRGRPDPHVWLDPVLAQRQVGRVLDGLVQADPAGRSTYVANAAAYQARLGMLHARIERGLRRCRRRLFVASHAAFGYFAARYGLTQIAISGLEPQEEPSPAKMREIVRLVRRHRVRVIYYETLVSPRVAAAIAREVGARTLVLNPVEGLTPREQRRGWDYVSIMEDNLHNLAAGLDCPR